MSVTSRKALVLFSGGQDSTTCLAWALDKFDAVETVGFAYGQRHAAELAARPRVLARLRDGFPRWREKLGADHVLSLDVLSQIGGSALTDDVAIAMRADGLPTTFVPGRNLMFLTAAAALGTRRGIHDLVGGMCETDYSGYPDCRSETIEAMQTALTLGFAQRIHRSHAADENRQGRDLAARGAPRRRGAGAADRGRDRHLLRRRAHGLHDWGYGCGHCPACDLRAKGYARYRGLAA